MESAQKNRYLENCYAQYVQMRIQGGQQHWPIQHKEEALNSEKWREALLSMKAYEVVIDKKPIIQCFADFELQRGTSIWHEFLYHIVIEGETIKSFCELLGCSEETWIFNTDKCGTILDVLPTLLQQYYYGSAQYLEYLYAVQSVMHDWKQNSEYRTSTQQILEKIERDTQVHFREYFFEQHWILGRSMSEIVRETNWTQGGLRSFCQNMNINFREMQALEHYRYSLDALASRRERITRDGQGIPFDSSGLTTDIRQTKHWTSALQQIPSWREAQQHLAESTIEILDAFEAREGRFLEEAYLLHCVIEGKTPTSFAETIEMPYETLSTIIDKAYPHLPEIMKRLRIESFDHDAFIARVQQYIDSATKWQEILGMREETAQYLLSIEEKYNGPFAQWFMEEHWLKNRGVVEIAESEEVPPTTFKRIVNRCNLPSRTRQEHLRMAWWGPGDPVKLREAVERARKEGGTNPSEEPREKNPPSHTPVEYVALQSPQEEQQTFFDEIRVVICSEQGDILTSLTTRINKSAGEQLTVKVNDREMSLLPQSPQNKEK